MTGKFKRFIKTKVTKFRAGRTPEAQLSKIREKRNLLQARQNLIAQRTRIASQRAALRKQQLKATGINVPKFIQGTQQLRDFSFGGFPEQLATKKRKPKPFNPFGNF